MKKNESYKNAAKVSLSDCLSLVKCCLEALDKNNLTYAEQLAEDIEIFGKLTKVLINQAERSGSK